MPRDLNRHNETPALTTQDRLAETKLAIEQARLEKIRRDLAANPPPDTQHTAYEDLPPPTLEERTRFIVRLQKLYAKIAVQYGYVTEDYAMFVPPDDVPSSPALRALLGSEGADEYEKG